MITIAICTKDRPQTLRENLTDLISKLEDSTIFDEVEILIVDSSDNQDTKETVNYFRKKGYKSLIQYTTNSKGGISFSRNKALAISKGKVIIFLDDDTFISNNWLKEVKTALQKFPKASLIGGKVLPLNPIPKKLKFILCLKENRLLWPLGILDWGDKTKVTPPDIALGTGGLIIRKEYLNKIGGFDESFGNLQSFPKIFGGEDKDFVYRACRSENQLVYYPKLVLYHKILPYKLTKKFFRWRYFENGKENANFALLHNATPRKPLKECIGLIMDLPLDLRRTFSEYLLKREVNFWHETHLFYSLGYWSGCLTLGIKKLLSEFPEI